MFYFRMPTVSRGLALSVQDLPGMMPLRNILPNNEYDFTDGNQFNTQVQLPNTNGIDPLQDGRRHILVSAVRLMSNGEFCSGVYVWRDLSGRFMPWNQFWHNITIESMFEHPTHKDF